MLSKEKTYNILTELGLKSSDTIMIHSSLKSIGLIEGNAEGLIDTLMSFFKDGLLIFPTHTWASIREDHMTFNIDDTPSCVGALTNIARKTPGFIRSMHPTHSVCAYGSSAKEYVDHDLIASTPVGPKNCFGILKDYNAKILFLGAPLSKNTFIHSIEEEYNVADRFTSHIYQFTSTDGNNTIKYTMPRHYSTLSAHISEHYEKLLPVFIKYDAIKEFYFGNALSYILDAKKAYTIVSKILDKNLHAFDDFSPIDI